MSSNLLFESSLNPSLNVTLDHSAPSTTRCISWSSDGDIALAMNENIIFLIPSFHISPGAFTTHLRTPHQIPPSTRVTKYSSIWHDCHVCVNKFPLAKSPTDPSLDFPLTTFNEPIDFMHYSLGENVSSPPVIACQWSPSGLELGRKCVLAVLTGNLLLSLWECRDAPNSPENWHRVSIINNTLHQYFSQLDQFAPPVSSIQRSLRLRIRSFTWLPPVRIPPCFVHHTSHSNILCSQVCILVVANELNQLLFLAFNANVTHPTRQSSHEMKYFPTVIGIMDDSSPLVCAKPGIFEEFMCHKASMRNLTCSSWRYHNKAIDNSTSSPTNQLCSLHMAYSVGSVLKFVSISIKFSRDNILMLQFGPIRAASLVDRDPMISVGPILWSPVVPSSHLCYLIVCVGNQIVCLTDQTITDPHNPFLGRRTVDFSWDQVSGWAFYLTEMNEIVLDLVTLMNGGEKRVLFYIPDLSRLDLLKQSECNASFDISREFYRTIHDQVAKFTNKYSLPVSSASAKVWDFTSSPLNPFVTTCFTIHPKDMIDYRTAAEEFTIVSFHFNELLSESRDNSLQLRDKKLVFYLRPDVLELTSEMILLTLKLWTITHGHNDSGNDCLVDQIWNILLASSISDTRSIQDDVDLQNQDDYNKITITGDECVATMVAHLNSNVYDLQAMKRCRFELLISLDPTLLSFFASPQNSVDNNIRKIVLNYTHNLLDISNTSFSWLVPLQECKASLKLVESLRMARQFSLQGELVEFVKYNDSCLICSDIIPLQSLDWAKCARGHEFLRCRMSFLPIQVPGISKRCSLCGYRYFSDMRFLSNCTCDACRSTSPVNLCSSMWSTIQQTFSDGLQHDVSSEQLHVKSNQLDYRRISFVELMLILINRCMYCGGKFGSS